MTNLKKFKMIIISTSCLSVFIVLDVVFSFIEVGHAVVIILIVATSFFIILLLFSIKKFLKTEKRDRPKRENEWREHLKPYKQLRKISKKIKIDFLDERDRTMQNILFFFQKEPDFSFILRKQHGQLFCWTEENVMREENRKIPKVIQKGFEYLKSLYQKNQGIDIFRRSDYNPNFVIQSISNIINNKTYVFNGAACAEEVIKIYIECWDTKIIPIEFFQSYYEIKLKNELTGRYLNLQDVQLIKKIEKIDKKCKFIIDYILGAVTRLGRNCKINSENIFADLSSSFAMDFLKENLEDMTPNVITPFYERLDYIIRSVTRTIFVSRINKLTEKWEEENVQFAFGKSAILAYKIN